SPALRSRARTSVSVAPIRIDSGPVTAPSLRAPPAAGLESAAPRARVMSNRPSSHSTRWGGARMTRARLTLLGSALLVALGAASLARAQCPPCGQPCTATSTAPAFLDLLSLRDGAPEGGGYSVIVRDGCNNPVAGITVTIDFTNCTDLVIASS